MSVSRYLPVVLDDSVRIAGGIALIASHSMRSLRDTLTIPAFLTPVLQRNSDIFGEEKNGQDKSFSEVQYGRSTEKSGFTENERVHQDFAEPRSSSGAQEIKVHSQVPEENSKFNQSSTQLEHGVSQVLSSVVERRAVEISPPVTDAHPSMEDQKERGKETNISASPTLSSALSTNEEMGQKPAKVVGVKKKQKHQPRERNVPSTQFGRVLGFAGLGASLAFGTFQESARRLWQGSGQNPQGLSNGGPLYSPFLTETNAERIALALCRMRGAALKLGQMLSIQDESIIPPQVLAALDRVRQGADVMPRRQLEKVLNSELGPDWKNKLSEFDPQPIAAASIGQVHRAVLLDGRQVAMKVQYPGVADSIDSDVDNLKRLLNYTNFIPKQLYLDQAIKVAKVELARECDYELEAINQKRFAKLMEGIEGYYVPQVIDELSSQKVLTTELVAGESIDTVAELSEEVRNSVATRLLNLTLLELFEFRFMQTDPNWGNFLYDEKTDTINLIDFGAARPFPKPFVDDYLKMVRACADKDRQEVLEMSKSLGFLTGQESKILLNAHVEAGFTVGLPFSKEGGYDFRSTGLTRKVTDLGTTMLQHRLTPPPEDAYSLHRKLSGSFLACIKLQAVVPCREMFFDVYNRHVFGSVDDDFDRSYGNEVEAVSA